MNARIFLAVSIASTAVAVTATPAAAQIAYWDVATGDWNIDANWDTGLVPIAGDSARITNGGTAQLLSGTTPMLASVYVATGNGSTGRLEVLGGVLNSGITFQIGSSGNGTALFKNSTVNCDNSIVVATNGVDALGHLDIRAGAIVNTPLLIIGNNNFGSANHNQGEVNCTSSLSVSGNFNSVGLYEFEAGSITALYVQIGSAAGGTFHQSGGTLVCGEAGIIGNNSTGSGLMTISGGSASFSNMFVGSSGTGVYRQKFGTVTITGSLRIGLNSSSTGVYKLQGGNLTAANVFQGNGSSTFDMTGGRFVWSVFGSNSVPFDLSPTGGVLAPRDTLRGIVYVRGTFSLGLGATYEADIHGTTPTANQDQINVKGMVRLAGPLDIKLGYTPAPGDEYVVILNDDIDPVAGEFLGMPEGSCFDAFFPAGTPHRMTITYAGGDGNDVVITNMGCPVDFNMDGVYDFFDVSAFLVGYAAMQPCFDMNNDGLWDFFDVAIFLTEFTAGCP